MENAVIEAELKNIEGELEKIKSRIDEFMKQLPREEDYECWVSFCVAYIAHIESHATLERDKNELLSGLDQMRSLWRGGE